MQALWEDYIHKSLVMTDNGMSGSTSFTCCAIRATRESSAPVFVPRKPCATLRGLAPKSEDENIVHVMLQAKIPLLYRFSDLNNGYIHPNFFLTIESVLT